MDEIARIRSEYEARARSIPEDRYAWHRKEIQYWQRSTSRVCRDLLKSAVTGKAILDVGCGTGQWLEEFAKWGAAVYGIDLIESRALDAQQRLPSADVRCGDASHLPWPDKSFDVVSQFTVFSSILDPAMRQAVANEMLRVLRPGGQILWYDCRYANPRSAVRGLNRADIRALFLGCSIRFQSATLYPPLSRAIARHSWTMAAALEALPFLRTHLAALITPDNRQ